jgi:hypothetical protein
LGWVDQSTTQLGITATITTVLPIANRHLHLQCRNGDRKKIFSVELNKEKTAGQLTFVNSKKPF